MLRFLPLAAVLLAGALLYAPVLGFDYTYYDDHALLVGLRGWFRDPTSLARALVEDVFARLAPISAGQFYRPLLLVSFVADTLVGDGRVSFYHATSLLLHLAATGALFALLRDLGHGPGLAAWLALLFCVHPIAVPVVAWLPCRNDSLLALFAIATLLAMRALVRGRRAALVPAVWAGLAAVLLTKESGLALVALLPLVAVAERRPRELLSRPLLVCALGALLLTLAWVALRRLVLEAFPVGASRAFGNLPMLIVYVGKSLFPVQLSVYPDPADASLVPGLAAIALLGLAAACARRRLLGWAGFGLAWYAAFLAPTLLAPEATSGLEHRLYVPLVGLVVFVAEALPSRPPMRRAAALAAAIVAATWAHASWRRLPDYADGPTFWRRAVTDSPRAVRAWQILAFRSLTWERPADAERAARGWIELEPRSAAAHAVLGASLARQGRQADADAALLRVLAVDPRAVRYWEAQATERESAGDAAAARESRRLAEALRRASAPAPPAAAAPAFP